MRQKDIATLPFLMLIAIGSSAISIQAPSDCLAELETSSGDVLAKPDRHAALVGPPPVCWDAGGGTLRIPTRPAALVGIFRIKTHGDYKLMITSPTGDG